MKALAIVESISDASANGNAIHEFAGRLSEGDPERAVRFVQSLTNEYARRMAIESVCRRMARVDPRRTRLGRFGRRGAGEGARLRSSRRSERPRPTSSPRSTPCIRQWKRCSRSATNRPKALFMNYRS